MRKIILSAVVIVSFTLYALYNRSKGPTQMPVITSATIGSNKAINIPPTNITATQTPPPTNLPSQPTSVIQQPASTVVVPTSPPKPNSPYKDGQYDGSVADAFYGNIQVRVTVSQGKITDIQFLQYPNDRDTSIAINQQADPMLAQEAIQAQSANVDIVSGATDSSQAFIQSMQTALNQAKS